VNFEKKEKKREKESLILKGKFNLSLEDFDLLEEASSFAYLFICSNKAFY
jgi:hypothetical protein